MERVLRLNNALEVSSAGGKGAALARLLQAGFKVPDGFVVTSAKHVNKSLTGEILAAFDKLDTKFVAVRSSAAAEDGAKDAWAGQLDTFLSVARHELVDKVSACFRSANSERAKAYAVQKGISPGKVAVIVQKMVPADASGVAFSAHPVTKNINHMVIESVKGLGEKLVSGLVTPDTHVLDKQTKKITEKYLATGLPFLSGAQLEELADKIIQIEKVFGFPVDVEWAFAGKELFILQSRPITTLG